MIHELNLKREGGISKIGQLMTAFMFNSQSPTGNITNHMPRILHYIPGFIVFIIQLNIIHKCFIILMFPGLQLEFINQIQ